MQQYSRVKRMEAERKKGRKGLVILRYLADLFRFVDTIYRIFRMML